VADVRTKPENSNHQITNLKWFGKLTTLSQPVESLKVERVEGQYPNSKLQ
jgi:hypothetical protein